jgi:uncharacterized membrane protein
MSTYKNPTPTEVIDYLENYYETYNTLPTPAIECQETGVAYTAFGTNLQKKIQKAGSIKSLLTTFVGRGVIKKAAKKKVETIVEALEKKVAVAKKASATTA